MRKFVISPKGIAAELLLIVLAAALLFGRANAEKTAAVAEEKEDDYIKWVEFNVSYEALDKAYQYDVDTYGKEPHLDWIELLSYLGAKYGGDFTSYKAGDMDALAEQLSQDGADMEALTKDMQYYEYYHEAYESVLGGMVGTFKIQGEDGKYTETYGLKAYHPIAKGFPY